MPVETAGFALSVDLGTSNTVAVIRWPDGRTRPLLVDGAPIMPSGVYLDEHGRLHIGRDAARMAQLDPARFEPSPKRHIDSRSLLLGDREILIVDLFAALLSAVARAAVEAVGFLPPAVLTYPAAWGKPRRDVLLAGAARAGYPPVALIPEPVAAARYFADVLRRPVPYGASLAVFDFGGGTLDIAVVRNDGGRFTTIGYGGVADLGGLDIDAALVEHLGRVIAAGHPQTWQALRAPADTTQRRARRLFWDDVRGAKEMLSRTTVAPVAIPGVDAAVHLTREELDRVAGPLLHRAVSEAARVIAGSGLRPDQLAGLFLVGGSSRLPTVARLLHAQLGIAPTVLEQPELPVAEGALGELAPAQSAPQTMSAPAGATGAVPVSAPPGTGPFGSQTDQVGGASGPLGLAAQPVSASPDGTFALPGQVSGPPGGNGYDAAPSGGGGHGPVPGGVSPAYGGPTAAGPGTVGPGVRRAGSRPWYRRRPTWIAAAAAVVAVAVLAGFLLLRGTLFGGATPVKFGELTAVGSGLDLPSPYSPYYAMSRALGDRAYVGWVNDKTLRMAALDLTNGKTAWGPKDVPGGGDKFDDMVVTSDALVVVGETSSGTAGRVLRVLDPATGNQWWEQTLEREDTFVVFGDTVAIDSDKAHELRWYGLRDGKSKNSLPDPKVDSSWITTTTYAVSTAKDRAGPVTANGTSAAPDFGDDERLVQITSDKKARVIDKPGHVQGEKAGVGDSSDKYMVADGRLFVATSDSPYVVKAYSLDKISDEPKSVYTSPDPKRSIDAMTPCGDGGVCLLDKTSYDHKDAQVVSRAVDGNGKNWAKPAAGAENLVNVGDRALAVGSAGSIVSYLFDPDGKQLISDTGKYAVRVNARSLLLLNHEPSTSPGEINLRGLNADNGDDTAIGTPQPPIAASGCAWTESVLTCPAQEGWRVWRFTR